MALSTGLLVRSYRGVCFEKTRVARPQGGPPRCLQARQPTCAHYRPASEAEAARGAARRGSVDWGFAAGRDAIADLSQFALRGDRDYDPVFAARLVVAPEYATV